MFDGCDIPPQVKWGFKLKKQDIGNRNRKSKERLIEGNWALLALVICLNLCLDQVPNINKTQLSNKGIEFLPWQWLYQTVC